jgi:hypothetical protein
VAVLDRIRNCMGDMSGFGYQYADAGGDDILGSAR